MHGGNQSESEGAPEGEGQGQTKADIGIPINPPKSSMGGLRSCCSAQNQQPTV